MPTSLRLKPDLEERYTMLAQTTGRSKAFYFNQALENQIDRLEYEYGILQEVEQVRAGKLETYSLEEVLDECNLLD